jgi:phage tail protein X
MASFVEYITKEGERWDTVAFKAYGDAANVNGIIEANPSVSILPILPIGTRLKIPVIEQGEAQLDSDLLPPWKR